MARTINEIQQEILGVREAAAELNALEVLTPDEVDILEAYSNSKVANWRLWVYIVAVAIWALEKLQDIFKVEVEERIATSRIHTKDWYRDQALAYQHGHELGESAIYDNTGRTEKEVIDAKIVTHAAVLRVILNGRAVLRVKVARGYQGNLNALDAAQLTGLLYYMNRVADAGTTVVPTSGPADLLKLNIDLYYDPIILDNEGKRLDGANDTPIVTAINEYLSGLKFNGRLTLTKLVDELQSIEGVELPKITDAWSKYGLHTYETEGVQNVGVIDELRVADSGYMNFDEDNSVINYITFTDE